MKGILLAGGTGSRLKPLTNAVNKHLLPMGDRPMIMQAVEAMRLAAVTDLLVVTTPKDMWSVTRAVGEPYESEDDSLSYQVQFEPDGIVGAIRVGAWWAHGEPVIVMLADNLFDRGLAPVVSYWCKNGMQGARALVCAEYRPEVLRSSGVPEFEKGNPTWVVKIHEKPSTPPSCCVIPGFYMFDSTVWTRIDQVVPSDRGELEITSLLNLYAHTGHLNLIPWSHWQDAGSSIDAYYEAVEYVRTHGVNN